jgi:hypothetical protein
VGKFLKYKKYYDFSCLVFQVTNSIILGVREGVVFLWRFFALFSFDQRFFA